MSLEQEVTRLRAENAELRKRALTRDRIRRSAKGLLLVLGCGLAALALLAIWLRGTLLDTDRYVDTVAPIAAEPAVQDAVADRLSTAVNDRIDFAALAREVLPERADVMAPVIETGVERFIGDRITAFTRSPRFQALWTEANRRAHTRLVELLEGGRSGRLVLDDDTVYLDLSPVVDRVKGGLQERGLTRVAAAIPPTVDGRVELVQSSALSDLQWAVKVLKAVAILLPVLALLCLAGAVWLSRSRRRGLLHASIGVALAMLLLIAALAFARSAYLDALGGGALPRDAASNIFDTVIGLLRDGLRLVIVAAILIALLSYVAGLPLRRLWASLLTDSRRGWFARNRNVLLAVIGGLAALALVVQDPLTGGAALVVLLIAGVLAAAVTAAGLGASPLADEAPPPRFAPP